MNASVSPRLHMPIIADIFAQRVDVLFTLRTYLSQMIIFAGLIISFSFYLLLYLLRLLSRFVRQYTSHTMEPKRKQTDRLASRKRDIFHPPDRYGMLGKIGSYRNIVVTPVAACSKSRQFRSARASARTLGTLETGPGSRPQFQGDVSVGSDAMLA